LNAVLLILMGLNGEMPQNEQPIVADWQEMESDSLTGDVALQFVRDSRVLANENTETFAKVVPWRVRFDGDNIRIDGIPQWIDLEKNRPARVPDRVADIEFGRDYGNGFGKVVKYFKNRPTSIILNKSARWNFGLRELDKSSIYAPAFVLRPNSACNDRLHPDRRTYGLSRVAGPTSDYLVVRDLRQNEVVRDIWVDPMHRHRITRVIEYLQGHPSLQADYEYTDDSNFPSQWNVMRLQGQRIIDFATVKCTSSPINDGNATRNIRPTRRRDWNELPHKSKDR